MQLGIFAKTFPGTEPAAVLAAVRGAGYATHPVQPRLRRPARDAGRGAGRDDRRASARRRRRPA